MTADRASMPAEFFDRTSAQLLLKPEPQYLYAQMLMKALSLDLPIPESLGHPTTQLSGVGADYSNDGGNFMLQPDGISDQVFAATMKMEGEPGHTVKINRPLFADTTYTQTSRQITSNMTISTTPISVGSEQNTLTLARFAGPYDQANARVAPFSLDGLDTQVGVHKASKIVGTHMKRDFNKFLDSVITVLADTGTGVWTEGITADNDITAAGQAPLSYAQISYTERLMDDANLPTLPDGYRLLVVPPAGDEALKHDVEYRQLSFVHKEMNALFPATYLKTVGKFHVFKSTTLSKPANTPAGIPVYRAHAIAPGAFGVGMGKAPRVAFSNDNNYGEAEKVIWLAYLAFGLMDSSFIYTPRFTAAR
jgi:hypothetical protein